MNTAVGYLPGDRWLVAGDTAVVQLAGESSDAMRWWPAVRSGADATAVIGQVYTDGVLGSHAPLVIVCIEPSDAAEPADTADAADEPTAAGHLVRVLAQGDATAVVETVSGQRVWVTGTGLLTWSEVLVENAAVVYLPGADPNGSDPNGNDPLPAATELLPMPAGVVRAGTVRWQLAEVPPEQVSGGDAPPVGSHAAAGSSKLPPPLAPPSTPPLAPSSTTVPDADVTQDVPDIDDEPDPGGQQGSLSPDNPFPSISVPPFSPPPFIPVPTSLPPIQPTDRAATPVGGQGSGDHDGHTRLAADLPPDAAAAAQPADLAAPGPGRVYAVLCPAGHANAPHTGSCRVCGAVISPADPVITQRPLLGRIRLSTGPVVDVGRRVVIGRAPSASRVSSSDLPQLLTVPSPQQDISRSHVEVRTEDWHLVVADLNSTNGTMVRAPGRPEQMLHPGEVVIVEAGWAVDLGDGVSFVVERPVERPAERPR